MRRRGSFETDLRSVICRQNGDTKIEPTRDEDGATWQAARRAMIVAMDTVGYSRAMSADEQRALMALAASRNIIDPTIAAGRGGSSRPREMASSPNLDPSRRAALDKGRRGGVNVLPFRIGIHTGRVFPVGRDLLGDVVNTAARIGSLANPGGMCVSEHVVSALPTDAPMLIEPKGRQVLDGIGGPVRISRIRLGGSGHVSRAT